MKDQRQSRRRFLTASLATAGMGAAGLWPGLLHAAPSSPRQGPAIPKWPTPGEVRQVWLRRQQTGEAVIARYYDGSGFQADHYLACCRILRDVQTGTVAHIDVELLDLIFAIQRWLVAWGIDKPLLVHSGYRTPWTNQKEGGARNSMHMQGRALDFSIPGIPPTYLGRLASIFQVGGVGFYVSGGFTHVDTGSVRYWVQK